MPKLVIEQPGVTTRTIALNGDETGLGRAEDNDVVLVADEVSRHHAKVVCSGSKTTIHDLDSLNGTYVNRQRIAERVLSNKDEIWFGSKCRVTFLEDPAEFDSPAHRRPTESTLLFGLEKIREEMDDFTASMTMIATPGIRKSTPEPAIEVEKMSRAFRRLDALYKASNLLASDFNLENRLGRLLDLAIDVTGAERGFLMLRDTSTNDLAVKVAREMGRELEGAPPSEGIARRAAIDGEPVLMSSDDSDPGLMGRESVILQRITSAMCVPLKVEDRTLGSLYVDSRAKNVKFTEEDLELFQAMADQSAMALDNVRLHNEMVRTEKRRANLGRFLSPSLVEHVMNEEHHLALGGRKAHVTIMYCDIRGFTKLSEGLEPDDLVALLNEHFTAMTEIVFRQNGTLDKFIGDEVMALFGAPLSLEEHAHLAVGAAVLMQAKNASLNVERKKQSLPEIGIGIGINSGEVFSGYIGSPERLDYTVIGDQVNVASRLCGIAQAEQIIIGEDTYRLVRDAVEAQSAGTPVLRGRVGTVQAYQVTGLKR